MVPASRSRTRCGLRAPRSSSSGASGRRPSWSRPPAIRSSGSVEGCRARTRSRPPARWKAGAALRAPRALLLRRARRRGPGRRRLCRGAGGARRGAAADPARARRGRLAPGAHPTGCSLRAPPASAWRSRSRPRRRPLPGHRPRRAAGYEDRAGARAEFGLGAGDVCVLVFGGSLGARSINEAAVRRSPTRPTGSCTSPAGATTPARRRPGRALRPARLRRPVRARAGGRRPRRRAQRRLGVRARAVRAAVGARALPARAGDHQTSNARWMERGGAAVVVPDAELRPSGCAPRSTRSRWTPPGAPRWRPRARGSRAPRPRRRSRAKCSPRPLVTIRTGRAPIDERGLKPVNERRCTINAAWERRCRTKEHGCRRDFEHRRG